MLSTCRALDPHTVTTARCSSALNSSLAAISPRLAIPAPSQVHTYAAQVSSGDLKPLPFPPTERVRWPHAPHRCLETLSQHPAAFWQPCCCFGDESQETELSGPKGSVSVLSHWQGGVGSLGLRLCLLFDKGLLLIFCPCKRSCIRRPPFTDVSPAHPAKDGVAGSWSSLGNTRLRHGASPMCSLGLPPAWL